MNPRCRAVQDEARNESRHGNAACNLTVDAVCGDGRRRVLCQHPISGGTDPLRGGGQRLSCHRSTCAR